MEHHCITIQEIDVGRGEGGEGIFQKNNQKTKFSQNIAT